MYKEHFGLQQEPFRSTFEGLGIYVGPQQATVISRLTKALGTPDAIATVTGPVGIGKTTLVSRALEVAAPERRVAHIGRMRLAPDEVLELLLEKFGVSRQPVGTIQRFATFKRLLDECAGKGMRAIIVVEDARRIGVDALMELEAMTAADGNVSSSANIVLMGDRELPALLADASLARLRQRTRTRQTLEPYTVDELHDYLKHCVHLAGGEFDAIFERGSIETLHHCSEGIPRIVNNICETALTEAADENAVRVSVELLQSIARDVYGIDSVVPALTMVPANDEVMDDELDDLEQDDEFFSAGEFVPDEQADTNLPAGGKDEVAVDTASPEVDDAVVEPLAAVAEPDAEAPDPEPCNDERVESTVPSLSLVTTIRPYDPVDDAPEERAADESRRTPAAEPQTVHDELPDPDALFDDEPPEEGSDDDLPLHAVADIPNDATDNEADDQSYDPYASVSRIEENVVEEQAPAAEANAVPEPDSEVAPEPVAAEADTDDEVETDPEGVPEPEVPELASAAAEADPEPAPEHEAEESPEVEPSSVEPVTAEAEPEESPEPELAAAEPVTAEPDTQAATPELVAAAAAVADDAIPVLDVVMPEAANDRDEPALAAAAKPVEPEVAAEDPIPVLMPESPVPAAREEQLEQPVAQATDLSLDEGDDAVPVLELETADSEAPAAETDAVSDGTDVPADDEVPVLTESMEAGEAAEEPVPAPAAPARVQAIAPEPERDESSIDTMTPEAEELIGALDELELAISSANEPDATPAHQPAQDDADAAADMPDITLDRNLEKPAPQQTDMNRWQEELANAKSLEEMSDLLAETVFGDQEFDRIAAEVTKNGPPEGVEAEPATAVAEPAPKAPAEPAADFAIELEPEAELVPTGREDQRGATGGFDLSMSKRFELLKSLGSSVANIAQNDANIMEITLGEDAPMPDAATDAAPEPIESQIDTEITQSRLALTEADLKKLEKESAPEEPEPEKQSNGFFGLFKRSSK